MMYAIPLVFTGALFLRSIRRNTEWFAPANILIGLYVLSSLAALIHNNSLLQMFYFEHSPVSLLGYSVLIALCLLPSLRIERPRIPSVPRDRRLVELLIVASAAAWFAFLYQLPYAVEALRYSAADVRLAMTIGDEYVMEASPLTTLAVAVSSFYAFYILLFFLCLSTRQHVLLTLSMFVGGLLYVVSSITFSARDGAVWYVLCLVWGYWLFKPGLNLRTRRCFLRAGLVSVTAALAIFLLYTIQRFGEEDTGTFDWIVNYIGAQPYVFCETVAEQTEFYHGNLRFPLIKQLMGAYEPVVRTTPYEWYFGTFVRDFYSVAGWTSAILLCAGFGGYFYRFLGRVHRVDPVRYILLSTLYFQLVSQGVFYFRLGLRSGNAYILILIAASVYVFLLREYPHMRAGRTALCPVRREGRS